MLSGFGKACTCVHNPPHISTLATQWQVPRDILGEGGGGCIPHVETSVRGERLVAPLSLAVREFVYQRNKIKDE